MKFKCIFKYNCNYKLNILVLFKFTKFMIFYPIISMKFLYIFNKTPLYLAIENQNPKIVEALLKNKNINVNLQSILINI